MEYIADLHIHSKYAGACSEHLTLEGIAATAREKGIQITGTGDFTHPLWLAEIKSKLAGEGNGLYSLKNGKTRFILSSEVCTIFEQGGTARKIHHLIFAPDIEAAEQIDAALSKYGSLQSDGRPILNKLRPAQLTEIVMDISKDAFIFPAHAWTPYFGVLGYFSGFNSLEEAYEDQAKHIYALEMGLSSDPPMNWRISKLDKYTLLGGSDAHSLPKMGREAVVFEMGENPSYKELVNSIKGKRLKTTIKFYPEEGKYHFDGHRNCSVSLEPAEAKKYNGICPVCRKRMTIGVLHRVEDLADRESGFRPPGATPYVHAIPLQEIIAYVTGKGEGTSAVRLMYERLVKRFGSEFDVLLKGEISEIGKIDKDVANAIERVREEKVNIIPGYDGVFGVLDIFGRAKKEKKTPKQSRINDFQV